ERVPAAVSGSRPLRRVAVGHLITFGFCARSTIICPRRLHGTLGCLRADPPVLADRRGRGRGDRAWRALPARRPGGRCRPEDHQLAARRTGTAKPRCAGIPWGACGSRRGLVNEREAYGVRLPVSGGPRSEGEDHLCWHSAGEHVV